MGFSRQLAFSLTTYLIRNKLQGKERFPLVLMLEPTFRCNLACAGCGRIREYQDIRDAMLSVGECLAAVEESGAPVVSIAGGEPLLHPGIGQITEQIMARQRFVHLCTNGLLLEDSLRKFKPSPYLSFVLHLDGLAESHDRLAGRSGVFDTAVAAKKAPRIAGLRVLVNTTN
jgi:hopanoid biosynthesis associated radical SAM protein HpnH